MIVHETCNALCKILCPLVMKMPNTEQEWKEIAKDFEDRWNLPNCIGAVDGKHINIDAVPYAGSTFFNYKGNHSIVLMAVVNAHRRFIYAHVGSNGRVSDGGVWNATSLSDYLKDTSNPLNIPAPKALPGRVNKIPYFLVADEAFPLKENIMRPYPSSDLNETKRIFNYRMSRARINVECAFGILSSRFQLLKKTLNFRPKKVELFVMTCICLHNLLTKDIDVTRKDNESNMNPLIRAAPNASSSAAMGTRNEIAEYCNTNGAVEWQYEKI